VKLDYTATTNINGLLAFQAIDLGVFDVQSRIPRYWNQLFALYRYAFIHAVHVKVEFVNIGTRPFTVGISETNSNDYPAITMKILSETPRSKWTQCTTSGNKTDINLNYVANGERLVGQKVRPDHDYWCTVGAGPAVAYLPKLAVGYESTTIGTPMDAIRIIKIWYDIEFHTLNPQL
jgi:hypothetical protein